MSRRGLPEAFWRLAFVGFLLKLVCSFSLILGQAAFLKVAGAERLPYYYIAVSVLAALQGYLAFRGSKIAGLAVGVGAPLMGLLFFAQAFGVGGSPIARIFALYTGISVLDTFAIILFWEAVNERLTIKELRRTVGLLGGWVHLGGVLSGAITLPLMRFVSLDFALMVCGVFFFLAPIGQALVPGHGPEGEGAPSEGTDSDEEASLLKTPLVRVALVTIACAATFRYLITYEYSVVIQEMFTSQEDLASFVGIFDAAAKCLVLLTQFAVVGRLTSRLSLGGLMTPTSVAVGGFSTAMLFTGWAPLAIACHLVFTVLSRTVDMAGAHRLVGGFPSSRRKQARFLLQGIAFPGFVILSGVILLVLPGPEWTSTRWMFLLALAVVCLLAIRKVNPAYRDLLLSSLAEGQEIAPPEPAEGTEDVSWEQALGEGEMERLLEETGMSRTRCMLLRALARQGRGTVGVRYLDEEDPQVRANAVMAVLRSTRDKEVVQSALKTLKALVLAESPEERAQGAWILGELGMDAFASATSGLLEDSDPGVRIAAVRAARRFPGGRLLPAMEARREREEDEAVLRELEETTEFLGSEVTELFWERSTTWNRDVRQATLASYRKLTSARARKLALRWSVAAGPETTRAVLEALAKDEAGQGSRLAACGRGKVLDAGPLIYDFLFSGDAAEGVLEALSKEDREVVTQGVSSISLEERTWRGEEVSRLLDLVGWVTGRVEATDLIKGSLTSDEAREVDLGLEAVEALGSRELLRAVKRAVRQIERPN